MTEYTFPVGKVVGFHGLRGDVKIRPRTNNPTLLLDIDDVEVSLDVRRVKLKIADIRLEKRLLLASFEGYPDRTAVEHLLNAELFTTKSQLNELDQDEWWVDDLVGLNVYTTEGRKVGTVCGITGGAGELLEVASADAPGTFLIPFVKALVPVVDIEAKRVEVVDLPGLFDIS